MRAHLAAWPEQMHPANWHYDDHGHGGFFGNWSWEAAVAFGIEDGSFRDVPYYPKELADFGRKTR